MEGFEWLRDKWVLQAKLEKVKQLAVLAKALGVSLASLSIAWVIKNPNVTTAILGATRKEQLTENLKALEVLPLLTDEIVKAMEDIMDTKPVLSEF